jgi:hypothetical protein
MRSTEYHATGTRLSQPLAAAILSVGCLLLSPAAHAQNQPLNQPQARPQGQSQGQLQGQSPSPTISDQKLDAAAAAIGQLTIIRQSYEQKIAEAPPSDKQHIADEANDALKKAVTDQGLTVDEYNTIVQTAQNDPTIRQKLVERIHPSGQ